MIILNPEDFGLDINQGIVGINGNFTINLISDYAIHFKLSPENELGEYLGEVWECGSADKRKQILQAIKELYGYVISSSDVLIPTKDDKTPF